MSRPHILPILCLLAACGPVRADGVQEGAAPRSHQRVLQVLQEGERARSDPTKAGAERLAQLAQRLQRMGAQPDAGEDDLAARWLQEARARGAVPVAAIPMRGRVLGPVYRRMRIDPAAPTETQQLFLAGQKAMVTLMPVNAAETGLQLHIVDAENATACTAVARGAQRTCQWIPVFTQRYRIGISQRGARPVDAFVVVN